MKESGFATAIEKLGAIIQELERELELERYMHDEAKKENAILRAENMKLRDEIYTSMAERQSGEALMGVTCEEAIPISGNV